MHTILDCGVELIEILGLNNDAINVLVKDKSLMNYTCICSNSMKNIKEKENIINNHIEEIENIINGEYQEEKMIIEEIMSEKKGVKNRKLFQLLEEQTDFEMKNNMKVVERIKRIVVKGRKVVDFPNFKNKKKKRKG